MLTLDANPRPATSMQTAGVCTFLTMSYILLVNPQILAVAGAFLPARAEAAQ